MKSLQLYLVFFLILLGVIGYVFVDELENKIFAPDIGKKEKGVSVIVYKNSNCTQCTSLNKYLEAYKKAGVKFGNILTYEYGSDEYKLHKGEYKISKLPFVVFSKELEKYKTISTSWENTFGYKNNQGNFIVTDIIPPYYNLDSGEVEGLLDMVMIKNSSCLECYSEKQISERLESFGLIFQSKKTVEEKSIEAINLIKQYNIKKLPVVIISEKMKLYSNFSSIWNNFGTQEKDGKYILRNPEGLGLTNK